MKYSPFMKRSLLTSPILKQLHTLQENFFEHNIDCLEDIRIRFFHQCKLEMEWGAYSRAGYIELTVGENLTSQPDPSKL